MARRTTTVPRRLSQAIRRFERWRSRRSERRIPDALWELATELGSEYGVARTSRALRLDYNELKRRVEVAAVQCDSAGLEIAPTFVEVLPAACASVHECLVELEDPCGAKMKIHLRGVNGSELAALGRLIFGGQA